MPTFVTLIWLHLDINISAIYFTCMCNIPQTASGYWHHVITAMLPTKYYQLRSNANKFSSMKTLTVFYLKVDTSTSYSCVSLIIGTRFHNPHAYLSQRCTKKIVEWNYVVAKGIQQISLVTNSCHYKYCLLEIHHPEMVNITNPRSNQWTRSTNVIATATAISSAATSPPAWHQKGYKQLPKVMMDKMPDVIWHL